MVCNRIAVQKEDLSAVKEADRSSTFAVLFRRKGDKKCKKWLMRER